VADCKHGFQSRFGRAFTNAFLSYREVFPPARWRSCPAAALAGFLSIALSSGWLDGLRLRPALDAGRPGMDGLP